MLFRSRLAKNHFATIRQHQQSAANEQKLAEAIASTFPAPLREATFPKSGTRRAAIALGIASAIHAHANSIRR